ncbi:hypothetical protein J2T08_000518 [Neorhizobium galegae]|uniref:site-specific integrase n=1 Tax=Neorhizobium galegae TaxID=399 RepID=UPI002788F306|nr:site-specific integrase [Neorhizobium galegae]MDQ0132617.1 hypothetical protein [Neorhizobium galegae]
MVTATGLKARKRKDGTTAYYWVASAVSRKAEHYPCKTIRIFGSSMDDIHAACRKYTSELYDWLNQRGIGEDPEYDGTFKSLITEYRRKDGSPYFELKSNTKAMYDESLNLLEKNIGSFLLEDVNGLEIRRWYNNFRQPAAPDKPERLRRAYKAMQLLRIVIGFGIVCGHKECSPLKEALDEMRFKVPKARVEAITFEQAQSICSKALELGLPSIAIAQAFQFELTLRQIDVIGRWEKIDDPKSGGIVDRGQRWRDGLLWSDIDENGLLTKFTSKTGQEAEHDTTAYPFLRSMIDLVPQEKRFGPIIRCETTGLPYRYRHFADVWRDVATKAGVPRNVWNRDSRAGGITEGSDSGADIEHLRHHANHSNVQMTMRYNRKTLEKTRNVAELRVSHRANKNGTGTDA